jgi:hypothetical protein
MPLPIHLGYGFVTMEQSIFNLIKTFRLYNMQPILSAGAFFEYMLLEIAA